MAFTREQARGALASLTPSQVFLDSYQVKGLPDNLDIYFGPPEEFFIAPDTQEIYTGNRLIPILDDGNFGLVTFLDPETKELIQMDVESPQQSRTTFRHWQQYLADLMLRIGESVEDDETVRRMSNLVGFTHTNDLFAFYTKTQVLTGNAWAEARRTFISKIPA